MKRNRLFAFAGSAIAAGVALSALLFVTHRGNLVQAGTILQSFRDSLARGFRVTITNVRSNGAQIDGQIAVLFDRTAPSGAAVAPAGEGSEVAGEAAPAVPVEALYADMHVLGDATANELAGLDMKVTVANAPQNKWAYMKTAAISEGLASQPLIGGLLNATRNGVLIEMDDAASAEIDPAGGLSIGSKVTAGVGTDDPAIRNGLIEAVREAVASARSDDPSKSHSGAKVITSTKVITANVDDSDPELEKAVREAVEKAIKDSGGGLPSDEKVRVAVRRAVHEGGKTATPAAQRGTKGRSMVIGLGAGAPQGGEGAGIHFEVDMAVDHGDADAEDQSGLGSLVTDLMTGRLSAERMSQLTSLIEQAAEHAAVQETEPGLFVLTASGFHSVPGLSDAESTELGQVVLRIAYRADDGVQWAELTNVGETNGTMRFEAFDGPIDPQLLDKQRLIEPGVTTIINGDNPLSVLGLFGAPPADEN